MRVQGGGPAQRACTICAAVAAGYAGQAASVAGAAAAAEPERVVPAVEGQAVMGMSADAMEALLRGLEPVFIK